MDFDEKTLVLGIGAQKAGTTWLSKYFFQRPDVYMPPVKEMHFFDIKYRPDIIHPKKSRFGRRLRKVRKNPTGHNGKKGYALKARAKFKNDANSYKAFFAANVPENLRHFGEITPGYAVIGEDGFREIRDLFPHRRLIFIMRDPVDRYLSQVNMRHENVLKRKSAVTQEETARARLDKPRFAELSRYEATIEKLEAVFDPQDLVYLFYETLFRQETIVSLCERLGLPYQPAEFDKVIYGGSKREPISQEVMELLLETFAPTYRYCRDRFGADIPEKWKTP
jgi:Sulfotransferase family